MNGTDGASGQLADVQRLMKRKVNAWNGVRPGRPAVQWTLHSPQSSHGKTVQAAADGAITVKDVAIDGNQENLASARGLFNAKSTGAGDCNTPTNQGVYAIRNWTLTDAGFR